MSGGHYQYAEWKLDELAETIERGGDDDEPRIDEFTPTRVLVGKFLRKTARLVHEVEWADSGDTSFVEAGEAIETILKESL